SANRAGNEEDAGPPENLDADRHRTGPDKSIQYEGRYSPGLSATTSAAPTRRQSRMVDRYPRRRLPLGVRVSSITNCPTIRGPSISGPAGSRPDTNVSTMW